MRRIAVFGATSDIATEFLRHIAGSGASLFIAARSEAALQDLKTDLLARGAHAVVVATFDAEDYQSHQALVKESFDAFKGLDHILIAHGFLPDALQAAEDFSLLKKTVSINFLSAASLITHMIPFLRVQGQGLVAVISSVAGDRGRAKIGVYGAAKAGLDAYLSSLRQQFKDTPIQFLTIKPGSVATKMTAHLKQGALFASADSVARDIASAMNRQSSVLYTPFYWRGIMGIIKVLPEFIFRKLSF